MVNNALNPLQSLSFTGSGNGGGLFAFDGDGTVPPDLHLPASDGVEGPLNTFTAINPGGTAGTVLFGGTGPRRADHIFSWKAARPASRRRV